MTTEEILHASATIQGKNNQEARVIRAAGLGQELDAALLVAFVGATTGGHKMAHAIHAYVTREALARLTDAPSARALRNAGFGAELEALVEKTSANAANLLEEEQDGAES